MVYLDNAATTFPKPDAVHDGVASFMKTLAGNPGRGGHRLAAGASRMVDDARLALARFIGAGATPERVVFAMNCTDALNIAVKGAVGGGVPNGPSTPHVVASVLEHNSVSRPLQQLALDGAIALARVSANGAGYLDPADVAAACTDRTRLVAITHASNVLGSVQPVAAIAAAVRERTGGRAWLLVDAAQTIGIEPIDVLADGVDLLAFPGHKALLGYPGSGGLYVAPRVTLRPWREGGTGGDSKRPVQPDEYPHRLEGGTHNTAGIASLAEGLRFIAATGRETIRAHELRLTGRLLDGLSQIGAVRVHGPRGTRDRVGTVAFGVDGYSSQDVAAILDGSFDIAIRAGLHCAPTCHRHIGTFPDGAVRASVGWFNTDADVDALVSAVAQLTATWSGDSAELK